VTQSGLSTCPICGAQFTCNAKARNRTCWCVNLPRIMPVPVDGKTECLCPDCLEKAVEAQMKDARRRD
jgi:hypothetical protein